MSESPKIENLRWGRVTVEGVEGAFKDAKLYPGGAREWDWRETGTHHQPGIQPEDVAELIEHGATVVVLSQGHEQRLGVTAEALEALEAAGIAVHVEETSRAATLYNQLVDNGKRVGALIHSTC